MKKRWISLVTAALLLMAGLAYADSATNGLPTGTIVGGPVTVYDGTWSNTNAVGTLQNGDAVIVMQQSGQMLQVFSRISRLAGWVPAGNVRIDQATPVYPGVVISQNVTLRESPSTTAKQLARPTNGTVLDILSEQNGWYYVRFWDGKSTMPIEGYVRTNFVVRDPMFVTTTQATYVYSMPDRGAKMVGQLVSGTQLVVIGEYGDFWVVNLRSASGFIHKNDIEYNQISGNG